MCQFKFKTSHIQSIIWWQTVRVCSKKSREHQTLGSWKFNTAIKSFWHSYTSSSLLWQYCPLTFQPTISVITLQAFTMSNSYKQSSPFTTNLDKLKNSQCTVMLSKIQLQEWSKFDPLIRLRLSSSFIIQALDSQLHHLWSMQFFTQAQQKQLTDSVETPWNVNKMLLKISVLKFPSNADKHHLSPLLP